MMTRVPWNTLSIAQHQKTCHHARFSIVIRILLFLASYHATDEDFLLNLNRKQSTKRVSGPRSRKKEKGKKDPFVLNACFIWFLRCCFVQILRFTFAPQMFKGIQCRNALFHASIFSLPCPVYGVDLTG
ncbi:hypothetical protein POPTR_006G127050v4 [Populus trichocarpa]|uniref:Uncharacterized protein n=1 Tax=Populus trichocarpa TaxID=3694 RepID=A0A3N7F2M4_POPTR|nr:hypothetical protein POPTR_006G127050v4 [Populus trichocarpa]